MNVRLPANLDDEDITADMVDGEIPLSVPTSMTGAIYRIKVSELCREVVDALPSQYDDAEEVNYSVVLHLDRRFRDFLASLPVFLRGDPESVASSREMCERMPILVLQRAVLQFTIYGRLCRLHRPYHLEGLTNSRYSYSHKACIADAQRVLEIRRVMEEAGLAAGIRASGSWILMQHVSVAALILATDVSFNPSAPNAAERKAKVLATCEMLEKTSDETDAVMEGVQRNVKMLIAALQSKRGQAADNAPGLEFNRSGGIRDTLMSDVTRQEIDSSRAGGFTESLELDHTDWDQLWKDFIDIAPGMDMTDWDLLLEQMQDAC